MLVRQLRTPIRVLAASAVTRQATSYSLQRRRTSTAASPPEDDLSQIQPRAEPQESSSFDQDEARRLSFLYFANVYPLRLGWWDLRSYFAKVEEDNLLQRIRESIPKDSLYNVKVEAVYPRAKDGGAFVKFSWSLPQQPFAEEAEPGDTVAKAREQEQEREVLQILERQSVEAIEATRFKPWFNFTFLSAFTGQMRVAPAFLVKGKPWMEDMNRFPNSTIRVEFEGPEIPQEELYEVFRPYGRISNIFPQPSSNKDSPRFADIAFRSMRAAAAARNCLHAAVIPSALPTPNPPPPTVVRILYAERKRANYIRDFATSHPRIMIPLMVALIGTLSYAVFDPIREFFVKAHVEGTFDSDRWAVLSWLKRETLGRLGLTDRKLNASSTGIEKEREEAKEKLMGWIKGGPPDSFIIVTGPKGSGKNALVKEVLEDSQHVLNIDCRALCKNSRSEAKLVAELADAVGYFPQFVLGSSINNMIDLAAMGLIGQKAGFSASLDAQLKAILEVTSSALARISNNQRAKAAAAAKAAEARKEDEQSRTKVVEQLQTEGVKDGRIDAVAGLGAMSELGVGVEPPAAEEEAVIVGPESSALVRALSKAATGTEERGDVAELPVVVLTGFAAKGESKQTILWDVLSEWAAVLVENQVAHVIFISDSVTVTKPLAAALPNKPFNAIALDDASPDASISWLEAKLSDFDQKLPEESKPSVARLGGRQTDLELLVSKVHAGFGVEAAVDDIVSRSATEIRKTFFGDDESEAKSLKWTRQQAWRILTGLTKSEELKYADVLVNSPFNSDEAALRALENAEMITIQHRDSRPSVIRPGKPVYRFAFGQLLADDVFRSSIEYQNVVAAINSASADLKSASQGLIELSQLFGNRDGKWVFGGGSALPREIEVRVTAHLAKMRESEEKLEKLGKQKEELLKVLAEAE